MTHSHRQQRGSAFLLTQLGTHAAARFAERAAELELTPPECGVLGLLRARPGISQTQLAQVLGMIPSRVVPLVDGLEKAGFVQRVRDEDDRRRNALQLTEAGTRAVEAIGRIGQLHEREVTKALTEGERQQLFALLTKLADAAGLSPGVHPGYRSLGLPARS